MNIFTYGSLMYPEVWQQIVSGEYDSINASITGYRRVAVRDAHYPMLITGSSDDRVDGVLYLDVSQQDIAILDAFEGDYYDRIATQVRVPTAPEYSVNVYVANSLGSEQALETPWDQQHFETQGLQEFCARYLGYSRIP